MSQRLIFDVTVTTSAKYAVLCSGRMIDTCLVAHDSAANTQRQDNIRSSKLRRTRYFTVSRIPPSAYGVYVGMTEQYSIPLYKVMGRVHVARGLVDNVAYVEDNEEEDEESHQPTADAKISVVASVATPSEPQLKRRKLIPHITTADVTAAEGTSVKISAAMTLDTEGDGEETAVAMLMRSSVDSPRSSPVLSTKLTSDTNTRTNTPAVVTAAATESDLNDEEALLALIEEEEEQLSVGGDAGAGPLRKETSSSTAAMPKTNTDDATTGGGKGGNNQMQSTGACFTRLYRDRVRHSTLGFDLAVRLLHKHTQRRYDHPQYTQIFIPHLEEDFFAFDGMSFLDTRY